MLIMGGGSGPAALFIDHGGSGFGGVGFGGGGRLRAVRLVFLSAMLLIDRAVIVPKEPMSRSRLIDLASLKGSHVGRAPMKPAWRLASSTSSDHWMRRFS